MKQILFLILAVVFLILGIIGLLLPVIPQVPFFLTGISFLTMGSKRFQHWFTGHSLFQKYLKKYVDRSPFFAGIIYQNM